MAEALPQSTNELPKDILEATALKEYKESDVFAWANNLVQYKDELTIELFLINKNYVVYRTNMAKELDKQLEPLFIDQMLDYVLEGAAEGLIVRTFEEAEAEQKALTTCNEGGAAQDAFGRCFLYASGDQVVLPLRKIKPMTP